MRLAMFALIQGVSVIAGFSVSLRECYTCAISKNILIRHETYQVGQLPRLTFIALFLSLRIAPIIVAI